ncbi:hypothetical protein D3C71_1816240 [compost metagenome]
MYRINCREGQLTAIRANLDLYVGRQGFIQQWQQGCTVSSQRLKADFTAQGGNAQGTVDDQQAFQVLLAVDFRRVQQQGGRASAAQLMKNRRRIAAVTGLCRE